MKFAGTHVYSIRLASKIFEGECLFSRGLDACSLTLQNKYKGRKSLFFFFSICRSGKRVDIVQWNGCATSHGQGHMRSDAECPEHSKLECNLYTEEELATFL